MSGQLGPYAHEVHRPNLDPSEQPKPVRRASAGISPEEALNCLMSIVGPGTSAGDSFSIHLGNDVEIQRFPGGAQKKFLETYAVENLEAALALGVERGWLEIGRRYGNCGEVHSYRLTRAGIEGSKTDRST
jgi:hypothetical protein